MVLHCLTLPLLVIAAAACLYYLGLALAALLFRPGRRPASGPPVHSFAIVIPAHNEDAVLENTLRSCADLDYPADQCQVFVIADNCTDRTADIARAAGTICLERYDSELRGKGHALGWALPTVLDHGLDAVLILDADCQIDAQALRSFDRRLSDGEHVLQARVLSADADASATGYAVAVASVLENDLFCRPKDRLGLAVFLRGTGMVFTREVLLQHSWESHSVVEDVQYTLRLLQSGLTVRFVPEVCISAESPTDMDQLRTQRRRWTAGTFRFGKRQALWLVLEGLRRGNLRLADAGWALLVQIKALVLLELLATLLLAAAGCMAEPGPLSDLLLFLGGGIVLLYGVLVGLGVAALGITRSRLALLLRFPLVVVRMVGIFLGGVVGPDAWVAARRAVAQR